MANEKMSNGFSSLILGLSVNKTDDDREKCRARLQEKFEACDSKLNHMIQDNRGNIENTVAMCSKVIQTVNESKNRCRLLKERITSCMNMLQYNRDNIRRMWLESLQHKYAHKILSEIQEMRTIPRKVNECLIEKKLEHATDVIVTSVKLLDGSLCKAEALKDLRVELHVLQEKLYSMILEDLRKNLYLTDFITDHFGDTFKEVTYEDVFSSKVPSKSDHSLKEVLNNIVLNKEYVTVLLNCLSTMNRMPDAMDFLKEICQKELTTIIQDVSKLMHDVIEKSADSSPLELPIEKQHAFLVDLIENTISVVQKILDNYNEFFGILQSIVETHAFTDLDFQIEDVYSKFQASLETFIALYLEAHPSSPRNSFVFESSQSIGGISSYFNPQNLSEDKNVNLFKFSNSCHAINLKKYSRETKAFDIELLEVLDTEDKELVNKPFFVCRPALRNITLIYNHLKNFVLNIEESLNLKSGDHCPLYAFLSDSANSFLDHVNSDINRMLKNASANLDAWNTVPVGDCSKAEKEVLSCSLILENILKELQNLMKFMPDHSEHFLRLLYYVILDYKDMYHRAFKQMFEEEQNILSVSWARDRDIRRLLKSFLNWRHLEDEDAEIVDIVESPEEIRLRNKEESDLLIRNLRSEEEMSWDIITDRNKLSNLALLQENLIWFSVELLKFVKNFNQSQSGMQVPCGDVKAGGGVASAITGLRKVIKEYEDFADMCLLALHLEVRARCFHYLLAFSSREICVEGEFVQEFDAAVKRLTGDLLQIDEVLLPILTPKEFKYVFEGLGELVASLMILVACNMNRINETVVRRIDRDVFVLQCCLANITMAREVSMERARQFIDLLKSSTPEEVLDQIVEEGPRFNEQEYASVFRLISCSSECRREPEYYLEKLKLIFKRLSANAEEPLPKVA